MKISFQKLSVAIIGKVLVDGVVIGEFTKHEGRNGFASAYSINTPEIGHLHITGWTNFKIAVRAAIAKVKP